MIVEYMLDDVNTSYSGGDTCDSGDTSDSGDSGDSGDTIENEDDNDNFINICCIISIRRCCYSYCIFSISRLIIPSC